MTFPCPEACGAGPFSTQNGAVMHAINKTDSDHESISDKASAYAALEEVENQETAEESEDIPEDDLEDKAEPDTEVGTTEGPQFPTAPDGGNEAVATPTEPEDDLEDTPDDTPEDDLEDTLDDVSTPKETDGRATEGLALAAAGLVLGLIYFKTRGGSQTTDDGPGFEVV